MDIKKLYNAIKSTIKYNNTKFKLKTNQTLTREIIYIYIYIYIIIIFIHHDLNKLLNSYTSHLMSILYKSSTNKYMIMLKNVIDKIMKNMIKLSFKKKNSL